MSPTAVADRHRALSIHPLRAVLLAGAFPLFLGAALSDWAYGASYEIQWANFAAAYRRRPRLCRLRAAGVGGGLGPRGAAGAAVHARASAAGRTGLGFVNALVHAKDGWAMMPEGLILSIIVTLLAAASIWAAFSVRASGARP